ncbi:hypothetical protein GCM10009795_022720 [Nocardioides hankookensis]
MVFIRVSAKPATTTLVNETTRNAARSLALRESDDRDDWDTIHLHFGSSVDPSQQVESTAPAWT